MCVCVCEEWNASPNLSCKPKNVTVNVVTLTSMKICLPAIILITVFGFVAQFSDVFLKYNQIIPAVLLSINDLILSKYRL